MNNLTGLKLYKKIKSELYEYYNQYYTQYTQEPTVGNLCEHLSVQTIGLDDAVVLDDKIISLVSKSLYEFVTEVRTAERTRERAERERKGSKLGSETYEAIRAGKSLEDLKIQPEDFFKMTKDSPADFELMFRMRERAIAAGETPTKTDREVFGLGATVETPEAPPEEPPTVTPEEEPETPPTVTPEKEPETPPTVTPEKEPERKPERKPEQKPEQQPEQKPQTETETETETDPEPRKVSRNRQSNTNTPNAKTDRPQPKTSASPSIQNQFGGPAPQNVLIGVPMMIPSKVPAFRTNQNQPSPKKSVVEKGSKDTPSESTTKSSEVVNKPITADMNDVRWHALRSSLGGIVQVYEQVHKPTKTKLGTAKSTGSKYRIVMTKPGGKKAEIKANSLAGVKRALKGATNYQVFNSTGTNISKYFNKK